jgi:hypothetical protein
MPRLSQGSIDRIGAVVKTVETQFADLGTDRTRTLHVDQFRWMQLTEEFDATTWLADANPGIWSPADNSGDGEMLADIVVSHIVCDSTRTSRAHTGDWVLCRPLGTANGPVWEIVGVEPPTLTPFELKDDCTPGGTGIAAWKLDGPGPHAEDAEEIEVNDNILQTTRAWGSDHSVGEPGDCGWYTSVGGVNYIVSCRPLARRCCGILTEALADDAESVTVDTVTVVTPGRAPTTSPSEDMTVYNRLNINGHGGYAGEEGEVVYFEFNEETEQWEIYDMACPDP